MTVTKPGTRISALHQASALTHRHATGTLVTTLATSATGTNSSDTKKPRKIGSKRNERTSAPSPAVHHWSPSASTHAASAHAPFETGRRPPRVVAHTAIARHVAPIEKPASPS